MNDKTVQPIEQKQVDFYGDELTAVMANDDQIYISVGHMCEALGLTTAPQTRRNERSEILADGYVQLAIYPTKLTKTVSQRRRAGLLRVDLVPLWLSGVRTNAVNEEIRPCAWKMAVSTQQFAICVTL